MSDDKQPNKQPNNLKTAVILLSVAVVFFIGVFIKRTWFS
ncbi:cytochrome oxidase small assembly protein [Lacisediminimonas profundi]|nr:cytochrome oxidase small assembly protein [Lacisediminimonas profundi]